MQTNKKSKIQAFTFYGISILHCFLMFSCAQIITPTGGPKDTQAPEITQAQPANFSTNFQQKDIHIQFNEWIQPLTNAKNQVIISPEIEPFPTITIARNDLKIHFKNELESNTTYSIFFGDNIKDNNEGNPYPNFKYVFSTGNFLDSLKVNGHITTNLDKIPDNTFLLLYKDISDSAFITKRPYSITKIKTDGSFELDHVKEGKYRLFALSDKNNNYFYDLPTEEIAFLDSNINLHSNLDTLHLELFLPEEDKLRIQQFDRIVKNGILNLTFNKEVSLNADEITATIVGNKSIQPIAFTEKDQKKMAIYFPNMELDSNTFQLVLKNKDVLIDTITIKTTQKKSAQPILFFTDSLFLKTAYVIEGSPLRMLSTHYSLSVIDTNKIIITDTTKQFIPFTISRKEDLATYELSANWKPDTRYMFHVSDSSLYDLVGNYNKMQEFSFRTISTKKSSNLLINYELPNILSDFIVILKDNSGKVLDKRILRDSQRVQINYGKLLSGTYTVEVIQDENKNGIWNSGNYQLKTFPEKIYKESKPIILKENWDAEETINVDFQNKSGKAGFTDKSSTLPTKPNIGKQPQGGAGF